MSAEGYFEGTVGFFGHTRLVSLDYTTTVTTLCHGLSPVTRLESCGSKHTTTATTLCHGLFFFVTSCHGHHETPCASVSQASCASRTKFSTVSFIVIVYGEFSSKLAFAKSTERCVGRSLLQKSPIKEMIFCKRDL